MKLNMGCGERPLEGFVNVDIVKLKGVDIVHDMEKFPYPFKDNSADFILMDNVIEHLNDTVGVMKECYRILKPGGRMQLVFPYYLHPAAWGEPTHKKALTEETFKFFWAGGPGINNPYGVSFREFKYKYNLTAIGKIFKPFIKILRPFCNFLILNVELN